MIMREIQLIDGRRIHASQMGFCSVHEHIITREYPQEKREEVIRYATERLNKAYSVGVRTIVDASPVVDIELLREVVAQTPMQVIASTGFYLGNDDLYKTYSVDDFLSHIMNEMEYGIGGTGIMPGLIKVATQSPNLDSNLRDWEIKKLTAAGIAQKETGLPVCVHSVCGFESQEKVLREAGADMSRVYFSHVEANQGWNGRSFEEEVKLIEEVLDRGSSLSFNNFNNWTHTPEECMARLIRRLSEDGYADHLMATMDFVWFFKDDKPYVLWEDICEDKDQRDYAYLVTHVQPWMRSHGIPESVIHAMNYENPARIFG